MVYGTGLQSRCFCHVYDAVSGVLAVIDSNATLGEAFNIGNDEEITIQDLATEVIELTKSKSTIEKVLYKNAYSPGFEDMQKRVPDISKIKKIVGWVPKLSLEEIIRDIANDLKA
jgi:UDP-glucose 4-epimerase